MIVKARKTFESAESLNMTKRFEKEAKTCDFNPSHVKCSQVPQEDRIPPIGQDNSPRQSGYCPQSDRLDPPRRQVRPHLHSLNQ